MRTNNSDLVAFINGVTGQDGSLLARHLLKLGYKVIGLSRKVTPENKKNLILLGIFDAVELLEFDVHSLSNLLTLIDGYRPAEIYELSGQSSVANSFINPEQTQYSIINAAKNWLEAIAKSGRDVKFFNPASSDCFGDTLTPADEETMFNPLSPYAEAKQKVYALVSHYRKDFGMYCSSGILFNHESNLRPLSFFSKKIIMGAHQIAKGNLATLEIGNLHFSRDWGWAPEYVEAIHLSLQAAVPGNYIIATGRSICAEQFIDYAFSKYRLNWRDYCMESQTLKRPFDIQVSMANPAKAQTLLGWKADTDGFGVIDKMTDYLSHPSADLD